MESLNICHCYSRRMTLSITWYIGPIWHLGWDADDRDFDSLPTFVCYMWSAAHHPTKTVLPNDNAYQNQATTQKLHSCTYGHGQLRRRTPLHSGGRRPTSIALFAELQKLSKLLSWALNSPPVVGAFGLDVNNWKLLQWSTKPHFLPLGKAVCASTL